MYELTSENLSGLGSSMGSERTHTNWRKFFASVDAAKAFAETDYGKPIKWQERGETATSGDLLYVMYTIRPVQVEG